MKEVAAGGTTTLVLCDETAFLWRKGIDDGPCPIHLSFSVVLPATFADEKGSYVRVLFLLLLAPSSPCIRRQALPPTYEAHLSGLPGFQAKVQYSVTAVASRSRNTRLNIGAMSVTVPIHIMSTNALSVDRYQHLSYIILDLDQACRFLPRSPALM